jgi:uncharacterized protein YycO
VIVDGDHVLHATIKKGVVREPASKVLSKYPKQIICHYAVTDAGAGLAWARSQIGKPYDLKGAFGLAISPDRDWQEDDSWFCFEIAAGALKAAGLDVFHHTGHITSSHLMQIKHRRA